MPDLIGRASELERLRRAAAAAVSGRSTVVAVTSGYGFGKTALLDAARADAVANGLTLLATQGRAADAELGFASLLTLMRPVEGRVDSLAGDLADDLRSALALGRRRANPVNVRLATLRLLSALAAERPLMLAIDDAHLLDRASADVLAFAVGRFCADAVLTVFTTESEADSGFDGLAAETITLGGLVPEDLGRVVAATVELAADPLRRCIELADGNPLTAIELALSLEPAERAGEAAMPVIPRLTGVLARAFARQLERLSDSARNALAVIAADDTGELGVVLNALGRLGEPEGGIAEAEAAGVVDTRAGVVRFTHPLLRPIAYHQVGAASRRVAHGALATALAAPHQGASRAWQLVAAADRPEESVAGGLALVAEDIARRGGAASAARTFECAAALTPDVTARTGRLLAATQHWLDAGDAPAAARAAESLVRVPATAEVLAVTTMALRGARPAASILSVAAAACGAVEAIDHAGVSAVLADELLAAGATDDAIAVAGPLAARNGPAGRLARAVLAAAGVRPVEVPTTDDGSAVDRRARMLAVAAAADAGAVEAVRATVPQGVIAVGGAGLDAGVSRAFATVAAGDVADAHDQLLRLDAIVPERAGIFRARLELALAEVELLLGRHADARQHAFIIEERASVLGLGWLRARAAWTLGRVDLAVADDGGALTHLTAASRTTAHLVGADLVTAALGAGRAAVANKAAAAAAARIDHADPVVDIRARRAVGAIGSLADLYSALDRAEVAGLPLEAAAVVMTRAEVAYRAGDIDTARAAANDASSRFAACGVSGWAPRLARLQRTNEPEVRSIASQLSPAEHRVALAVAEGRTNQEAADTLFLSVKTIDFHLQNIYRKLAIRSRTELAVALRQELSAQEVVA